MTLYKEMRLSIPSATTRYSFSIDEFKGIDKASGEDNFSPVRATEMHNFIRSKVGEITKRGGFEAVENLSGVKSVTYWNRYRVMQCDGDVLFEKDGTKESLAEKLGDGTTINNAVIFSFGQYCYVLYECDEHIGMAMIREENGVLHMGFQKQSAPNLFLKSAGEGFAAAITDGIYTKHITVPIIASGNTAGGGTPHLSPNILNPLVCEEFTVPTACKRIELALQDITLQDSDGNIITADVFMAEENGYRIKSGDYWKLTEKGVVVAQNSIRIEVYTNVGGEEQEEYDWGILDLSQIFTVENYDFINPKIGAVWIPNANIGVSPKEGEASVRITYIRNYEEYLAGVKALLMCDKVTKFGVGGYKDRVFLAADNRIYYSGMDEALYFGELCYVEPCSALNKIMAIGGQGKVLYAVDDTGMTYALSGAVIEDNTDTFASDGDFIIVDTVQGEKPIGSTLDIFGEEFCYLSENGLVAIRHDDFYDKRYAQNRSRLLGDSLKDGIIGATVWGGFLAIATANNIYLLDEMQQTTLKDYAYSGRQYEVFPIAFDSEVTIEKIWTDGEKLYVYTGAEVLAYNEERVTDLIGGMQNGISCSWISQKFSLSDIGRWKNILFWSLSLGNVGDAVKVYYRCDNRTEWKVLKNSSGKFRIFNYGDVDYGLWTYCTTVNGLQMIIHRRPSRRFRTIQFMFEGMKEHPITLESFGFNYEQEVI